MQGCVAVPENADTPAFDSLAGSGDDAGVFQGHGTEEGRRAVKCAPQGLSGVRGEKRPIRERRRNGDIRQTQQRTAEAFFRTGEAEAFDLEKRGGGVQDAVTQTEAFKGSRKGGACLPQAHRAAVNAGASRLSREILCGERASVEEIPEEGCLQIRAGNGKRGQRDLDRGLAARIHAGRDVPQFRIAHDGCAGGGEHGGAKKGNGGQRCGGAGPQDHVPAENLPFGIAEPQVGNADGAPEQGNANVVTMRLPIAGQRLHAGTDGLFGHVGEQKAAARAGKRQYARDKARDSRFFHDVPPEPRCAGFSSRMACNFSRRRS